MLLRPVHAKSAAVHQHDDERLAPRGKRLDQIFFGLRQIELVRSPPEKPG